MIGFLVDWVDSRTNIRRLINEGLYENIPCGARWRYITGSMLVFAFAVQAITGMFLWMAYSASSQTAFESVYFIQNEMTGGWLLRGVHHFMAQAMVVVMGLHLLQVIVDGAYRAPREVNYWLGLILMQLVMGLGLTGYLLPWDQKGFWATNVATNLMTLVPFVGKELQQLAVGGNEYGNATLTRFFAMHAGVLPALLVIFLAMHIAVFRKHGITAKITPGRADEYFWPHQVLLDAVGCLVLLGIVLLCVVHFDVQGLATGNLPAEHRGAELGAPADPAEAYSAARPEWYYLFLFQMLKYFHGTQEVIGALVIPGVVMTILFLMPFIGRSQLGHRFNVAFILFLLVGAGVLTGLALNEDAHNPEFQEAKLAANESAERMHDLINRREWTTVGGEGELSDRRLIQREGAVYLLRNDPLTRGPKLFAQHCGSCHDFNGPDVPAAWKVTRTARVEMTGGQVKRDAAGNAILLDPPSGAPNLYGFASREWLRGFLNPQLIAKLDALPLAAKPVEAKAGEAMTGEAAVKVAASEHAAGGSTEKPKETPKDERLIEAPYFGNTNHRDGTMVNWVRDHADFLKDDPKNVKDDLDAIVAALSAQAELRSQAEVDGQDQELIQRGIGLMRQNCARGCHRMGDAGELGQAPDLTGYGSYEWMLGFISDPAHLRFYGAGNDRMPSFAADLDRPETNIVSIRELSLIVDWLRGDYYLPEDKRPVLPHTEEFARRTVVLARLGGQPAAAVVGAAPEQPPSETQQAEELFRRNCAACHSHVDAAGKGIAAKFPSAPNLAGFASREWLTGLLTPEKIAGPEFFGNTGHAGGDMVNFVKDELGKLNDDGKQKLKALIVTLSAEAALPAQAEADKQAKADGTLEKGRAALETAIDASACLDCHKFHDVDNGGEAPDLTGYGSREWLTRMISDPSHASLYGPRNDRMPAFGAVKEGDASAKPRLSAGEIELLAKWLRGEKLADTAPAK